MTREQLASFVVRSLELVGVELEADASFPDVGAGSVHGEAISKLATAGIIDGYEDGTFGPRDNVSREQTATYVAGALELVLGFELPVTGDSFPDVSGTHSEAINKLTNQSVLDGYPDGNFRPQDDVTRAQMTKYIGNALGVMATEGHEPA